MTVKENPNCLNCGMYLLRDEIYYANQLVLENKLFILFVLHVGNTLPEAFLVFGIAPTISSVLSMTVAQLGYRIV